jgi:hypothetical protein
MNTLSRSAPALLQIAAKEAVAEHQQYIYLTLQQYNQQGLED